MMNDLFLAMENFPLEDYLDDFTGEYVSNDEYLMCCPMCGKDKLSISLSKKQWHCFVCEDYGVDPLGKVFARSGAGGLLKLVQLLEGLSKFNAAQKIKTLGTARPVSIRGIEEVRPRSRKKREPSTTFAAIEFPEGTESVSEELPYMKRRGITLQHARLYGLAHCVTGYYGNRLIFPVWDKDRLVYWQARAMWEEHEHNPASGPYKKTLNPSRGEGEAGAGDVLFNLPNAKNYPRVAICEGPIDVIHTGPSAVATFGKRISPQQIGKLLEVRVKAVDLMWDSDAITEMELAASNLRAFFDVKIVRLPSGDPGDWKTEDLANFRSQTPSLSGRSRLAML